MAGNQKQHNSTNATYPKRKPSKPGRVDLIPEEFKNLIEDQGIRIRISPAVLCPNRDEIHSTNHSLDCPVCNGDEVCEVPDQSFECWAFIQSVTLERRHDLQGIYDFKDLLMSTPSEVRMYYMYKIEILDFPASFNQLVNRGKRVGTVPESDLLRYDPIADSNTPIYVIDKAGVTYKEGKNFKIDFKNKQIIWKKDAPANGVMYSIIYPALPTFRVIEMMHESRWYYEGRKTPDKKPVNLPQQSLIRWDYLQSGSGTRVLRANGGE